MKKIIYFIPLLLLFPLSADAIFNTFNTSGEGQIILPSNGLTYTIQPSTRLESFTVGTSQMNFEMSAGSLVELKSADRSNFVVGSSPCEVRTTCENTQSTLLIHCTSDITAQTITVTIDGTCTGSTGSSSGSSGGAAAGGGGSKKVVILPPPSIIPVPPSTKPIVRAPSPILLPVVAPIVQKIISGTLGTSSKGSEVKKLEEKLIALGYLPKTRKIDGVYDKVLVDAVKKLQKSSGLSQVGVVGPATLKLLNSGILKPIAPDPVATPTIPPLSPPSGVQSFTQNLLLGSNGAEVKLLQEKLQVLGFFPKTVKPNGYFGPTTQTALKKFQSANGVAPVGYVGSNTRKVLNGK